MNLKLRFKTAFAVSLCLGVLGSACGSGTAGDVSTEGGLVAAEVRVQTSDQGHLCIADPDDMHHVGLFFPANVTVGSTNRVLASSIRALGADELTGEMREKSAAGINPSTWFEPIDAVVQSGTDGFEAGPFLALSELALQWPMFQNAGAASIHLTIDERTSWVAEILVYWDDGTVTPLGICSSVNLFEAELAAFRTDQELVMGDIELVESLMGLHPANADMAQRYLAWSRGAN